MPATILRYNLEPTTFDIVPGQNYNNAAREAYAWLFYNRGIGTVTINGKLIPEEGSYQLACPTPGGLIDLTRLKIVFSDQADGRLEVSSYVADDFRYEEVSC